MFKKECFELQKVLVSLYQNNMDIRRDRDSYFATYMCGKFKTYTSYLTNTNSITVSVPKKDIESANVIIDYFKTTNGCFVERLATTYRNIFHEAFKERNCNINFFELGYECANITDVTVGSSNDYTVIFNFYN